MSGVAWRRVAISPEHDLEILRPSSLPKKERFETVEAARDVTSRCVIPALEKFAPRVAEAVDDCINAGEPCSLPFCGVCARSYRRYVAGETLRIFEEQGGVAETATVYLNSIAEDELGKVDLIAEREALRKRLQRAGFERSCIIGGVEVGFSAKNLTWILHAHLMVINAPAGAWDNLECTLASSGVHDPLRYAPVNDPVAQLSYLHKFFTYHRPGKSHGNERARAFPLKPPQMCELASWQMRYHFQDFTFCYGIRRRHGRFCRS